jgi:predicted house-cleaning noncanonical NTP pyrophosphatase (MazG superfamily)
VSTPDDEAVLAGRMASEMMSKLAQHSDRRHWRQSKVRYLLARLREEVDELAENQTWEEAADVANFAAMIADKATDA